MAKFELKLPKMGESVAEATLTNWLKEVGDSIEADEAVLEIATDKVDSEVPSEVDGVLIERLFNVDDVIQVGQTLAIIETDGEAEISQQDDAVKDTETVETPIKEEITLEIVNEEAPKTDVKSGNRFYSPLVRNIASSEGIGQEELDQIPGTGKDKRVTKNDILEYLDNRKSIPVTTPKVDDPVAPAKKVSKTPISVNGDDEIIEMTRMGKLIAHHMIESVQTSAHVQSFIEVDVTKIWNWRNKVKDEFFDREGEKLTFTPIFMEAVARALREFPMLNISVDGDKIIKRKNINLGMAAALDDGNLIVPVIKKADQLNLVGMTKAVNDLASRAKNNKLVLGVSWARL